MTPAIIATSLAPRTMLEGKLEALYRRRAIVDTLIRFLEEYSHSGGDTAPKPAGVVVQPEIRLPLAS